MAKKNNPEHLRETALITGASSGIGLQFSKLFARKGYDLVLVSRNKEELKRISDKLTQEFSIRVTVIAKDLTAFQAPRGIFDALERKKIHIDILVNNAGFGVFGPFSETDLTEEMGMVQLHVLALTQLTKLFLKGMIERGTGRILNVASITAFLAGPLMACYFASKAYVLTFSEAISEELRGTGVTVTVLCPGPTNTGFQSRSGRKHWMGKFAMRPKIVARLGFDGMMQGKSVIVCGLRNQLILLLIKWLPRSWVVSRVYSRQKKRKKVSDTFNRNE